MGGMIKRGPEKRSPGHPALPQGAEQDVRGEGVGGNNSVTEPPLLGASRPLFTFLPWGRNPLHLVNNLVQLLQYSAVIHPLAVKLRKLTHLPLGAVDPD